MTKHRRPRTKWINTTTSDLQIANLSDALWFFSARLENEVRQANVSSVFRDRIARVNERLRHYATALGESLEAPNSEVFDTPESTRKFLNLLLDRKEGKVFS